MASLGREGLAMLGDASPERREAIEVVIILMTVISGIAYAAFRLNTDIHKGIINRFRTMPVATSA